jgi:hypothetical protein
MPVLQFAKVQGLRQRLAGIARCPQKALRIKNQEIIHGYEFSYSR